LACDRKQNDFFDYGAALASYTSREFASDQCIWRPYQLYEPNQSSGRQDGTLVDVFFPNDQKIDVDNSRVGLGPSGKIC
jgi:hypothetical protein